MCVGPADTDPTPVSRSSASASSSDPFNGGIRVLGAFCRIGVSAGPNIALLDGELFLVLNDRSGGRACRSSYIVRRLRPGLDNNIAQPDHFISGYDRIPLTQRYN
jgi:hypothetical protein